MLDFIFCEMYKQVNERFTNKKLPTDRLTYRLDLRTYVQSYSYRSSAPNKHQLNHFFVNDSILTIFLSPYLYSKFPGSGYLKSKTATKILYSYIILSSILGHNKAGSGFAGILKTGFGSKSGAKLSGSATLLYMT